MRSVKAQFGGQSVTRLQFLVIIDLFNTALGARHVVLAVCCAGLGGYVAMRENALNYRWVESNEPNDAPRPF